MSVKRELRRRFRQLLVVWIGGLIVIAASAGCTDGVDSQAFPDPPSPTSTGCELPARLAEAVELGCRLLSRPGPKSGSTSGAGTSSIRSRGPSHLAATPPSSPSSS